MKLSDDRRLYLYHRTMRKALTLEAFLRIHEAARDTTSPAYVATKRQLRTAIDTVLALLPISLLHQESGANAQVRPLRDCNVKNAHNGLVSSP